MKFSRINLTLAFMFLTSCAYPDKAHRPELAMSPRGPELHVVEIDDEGKFWDTDEPARTIGKVSRMAAEGNVVVLLYVHGWHHNADADDTNLEGLRSSVGQVAIRMAQEDYARARIALTGTDAVKVIGIYVGWRGRSMRGALDYATFWGRKRAAERVGANGLRALVEGLQETYSAHNAPGDPSFLGMVSVGHSFGGQALLKATQGLIAESLGKRQAGRGQRSGVAGLGDLTVLINPAVEALQLDELLTRASDSTFDCRQLPALMVVSGRGDSARKFLFPIGRTLSADKNGLATTPERKRMWRTALGEYVPQRTHELTVADSEPPTFDAASYRNPEQMIRADLTTRITLGGGLLTPLPGKGQRHGPFVIAHTDKKLVQRHSGIFTDSLRGFLAEYIAFVQGKRMVLRMPAAQKITCMP